MYLVCFPFFALAQIVLTLFAWMLAPLLALAADTRGNLPTWLYWFQTFDNTLDAGWKVQGNYGTYLEDGTVPTGITLWWYRTCWLCRNPIYGWSYWPFGMPFDSSEWTIHVDNASWWIATGPQGSFSVRSLALPHFNVKLGWKAWAYRRGNEWAPADYSWGPSHRIPMCGISISL